MFTADEIDTEIVLGVDDILQLRNTSSNIGKLPPLPLLFYFHIQSSVTIDIKKHFIVGIISLPI